MGVLFVLALIGVVVDVRRGMRRSERMAVETGPSIDMAVTDGARFAPHRALVVNASPAMTAVIARLLQESGWELVEPAEGQDLVDQIDRLVATSARVLLVVDVDTAGPNGLELVERVRAEMGDGAVQVLTIGAIRPEHSSDEYLTKPFGREVFFDRVRALGQR